MKLDVSKDDLQHILATIGDAVLPLGIRVANMINAAALAEIIKADAEAMEGLRNTLWRIEQLSIYEGGQSEIDEAMVDHLRLLYGEQPEVDFEALYDALYMLL